MKFFFSFFISLPAFIVLVSAHFATAQTRPPVQVTGVQGSVGIGFTDYSMKSPKGDVKIDRGTYLAASGERGFGVLNLYLSITLSYMDAEGVSNYSYTNLSSSTTYTATDVKFDARMMDGSLGLKLKLIDGYWFRPYVEGGGVGGYHTVTYKSKLDELQAIGSDFKRRDTIMGSGHYAEAGIEIQFSDTFGVKIAGRKTRFKTKDLETLDNRPMEFDSETYYLSALMGF